MLCPSRYRILAIGKIRKTWVKDGFNQYLKRLPGLTISELRDSTPQREEKAIWAALSQDEILVSLAEEGELLSSLEFANRLDSLGSLRLAFVIGGADGLTPELKSSAKWKLSLSPMTLPHELTRLILIEQLYRAHAILQGSPYHRGTTPA